MFSLPTYCWDTNREKSSLLRDKRGNKIRKIYKLNLDFNLVIKRGSMIKFAVKNELSFLLNNIQWKEYIK